MKLTTTIKSLLSVLLACFVVSAAAQSNYAQVLASAEWNWQTLDGVTYGKASFADLYGSAQVVSIAKYSIKSMSTSLFDKERSSQGTNGLAAEAGASVAINGSYFNMSSSTSTTAIWVDGKEVTTTAPEEFARCNGALCFKDGDIIIEPCTSSTPASTLAAWGKEYDAFVVAGPIIRRNGKSIDANIGGEGFYGPHPRTMVGKTADGTMYMVVMEGRLNGATGFSTSNMVSLAEDLGMTDAINLDGGGSSTLWVSGTGVVNRLAGGSVRIVPNIIIAQPRYHEHNYVNGFCTCKAAPYEPARLNSEGYYEIDNGGKLFWLAFMVNNGNGNINARLTADVDLESRSWTPMGNGTYRHSGEFDGQGHSIRNLMVKTDASTGYSSFIGYHSGTKDVHDFRISGTVTAYGTTYDHFASGVVASSNGAHKIEDVWCSVDVINPNTSQVSLRMAGVVVRAEGSTINRCVYDGTIKGAATNLQVAGILGWPDANNTTVSNCLFAGSLASTGIGSGSAYLGGIVGFNSSARTGVRIAGNLSIGSISSPKSATRSGALVGNNTADVATFEGNYVLEGLPVTGSATVSSRVPPVVAVTAGQLTDGTLPAKLGADNWSQGTSSPVPYDNNEPAGEDDMTVGGIKYVITGTNTVAVTYPNETQPSSANKCTYSGEVTIPTSVTIKNKVYKVTSIGDYAFHFADITALNLPEGITKLGYKSIYQTQLTEISVPNSVTLMDYEALGYNKVLQKITFGENIAANTWGDKLCIYGGRKYEVYMNCDAVPKLRSYTFDFTGANVHVRPSMYQAFLSDAAWSSYDIIGDLWQEYSYGDLQKVLSDYAPKLPTGDAVGTDPGCYSPSTVKAFSEALAWAQALDEGASLEQLNKAINGIMIAYDALHCYPLGEGYYYIENVAFPGHLLMGDPANASRIGLKSMALDEVKTLPYFKLTRRNGGWLMQCADNGMYVGTVVGSNSSGRPISLTEDARYEQTITSVGGGRFKIQGPNTYPYVYTGSRVAVYNYPAGGNMEVRQMWRMHPAASSQFRMEYNLENPRVQGFLHDFEYADGDASRISTYNVNPPQRLDWPQPATVFWKQDTTAQAQLVTWSEHSDFSDASTVTVPADAASLEIYNLIPGRTYYCRVEATSSAPEDNQWTKPITSFYFCTTGQMRHLKVSGTANVRDLGGWTTLGGHHVRYGKIFRGGELNGGHNLEPEGIAAMRRAGIKAELDLRGDSEAKSITASVLGKDVTYKRTPLGQTASHMNGLNNSKETYKAALQFVLTCVKTDKPVYFHCAIGRDRTGTLAFLIEGVLGMSKSDIYKDYELTNFSYWGTPCSKGQLDDMFAMIEAQDGETLEQKFRTYLKSDFGITDKAIDEFREKMLSTDEEDGLSELHGNGDAYLLKPNTQSIYTVSGQKMNAQRVNGKWALPRGLYISGGKKIVKN